MSKYYFMLGGREIVTEKRKWWTEMGILMEGVGWDITYRINRVVTLSTNNLENTMGL